MELPFPLKGFSRRRGYARSTVTSLSEQSVMERSRAWGNIRRIQRASGERGEAAVVRAQVSCGAIFRIQGTKDVVFRSQVR